MEMQDKEFDQLFNSKLDDFEVEPSTQVWQNITRELDGKKAKRSLMPYLSIAASVIVVASVALLFFNKTAKKQDKPDNVVKVKPVKPLPTPDTDAISITIDKGDDGYLKEAMMAAVETKKPAQASNVLQVEPEKKEITIASPMPAMQIGQPVLAAVPVEKQTLLQPLTQATDVGVGPIALVNQPKEINEAPQSRIMDPIPEKNQEKKRAHGLGGLFNTIIAAVDKREDKLIEFTDADDDEGSRVTGVNLGIFKIKKQ